MAFAGADHAMSEDFPITIYHNPDCGTSRNTLAMIRAAGYAPTVVEYLKTGWTRPQLEGLLAAMGVGPRDILREKGTPAAELGLLDTAVSDDAILDAMVVHPILVNRPIVVTPKGVKLSRPSEVVMGLLERQPPSFIKEDGEVVVPQTLR
jgi:arsenate reductase